MIQLHGVWKRYRGRREQPVLRGVDLAVDAGEIVLVSGETGSGKSTLLALLHAAVLPDAGKVEVFGRDLGRLRRGSLALLRQRIGIVPAELCLLENRSALDNVALALEVCAEPRLRMRARAAEALGLVGLACEVDTPVRELSSGQKQMVALARAIAREPSVLVADEPSGFLDNHGREVLIELLNTGCEQGMAAVVATNDYKLLSAGAQHGWRHVELSDGVLGMVADRKRDEAPATQNETWDDEYESYEVTHEDNVVPFPLAAHAGGLLE